jgi:hypothetical protein
MGVCLRNPSSFTQLARLTVPGALLGSLAFWFASKALRPFVLA